MSDSDTTDSDSGIRFKTTSTRYKSESIEKHSSSSRSSRSAASSSNRRSRDRDRDRDRGRDRRRSSADRSRSHRSRSRSRSRSRERRKRRDRNRRNHRSRSRSRSRSRKSPRPSSRRSRDECSVETKNNSRDSENIDLKPCDSNVVEPSKIESSKVLDISVSSLSSQEETIEKEGVAADYFGPALPPAANHQTDKEIISPVVEDGDMVGPALPPHLIKSTRKEEESIRVIGPTLPANLESLAETAAVSSESELSPFSEEEKSEAEDEDCIGPMPGASNSRSQLELEQRALEMKLRHLDGDRYDAKSTSTQSREDWMVELPDIRKISDMGLGARQFRTREKLEIGDRSVWTDTPSDRERKKTSGRSSNKDSRDREVEDERRKAAERDRQQEDMIKRHKKKHKRDKSLLELHQKKARDEKKKKEGKSDEPTRRPFDRNIDLHANRFDEAQKKAIFKKAQLLDTRFSSGASKYL